jgi:hypothetical protein
MNNRRMFFQSFLGHTGALLEDFRGIECFPLNRLKELPDTTIEQIEPVFFLDESWSIENKIITVFDNKHAKRLSFELNEIELQALNYFKNGLKLKETASCISRNTGSSFAEIYKIVTSLFFRLASLRICHPKELYHLDEILKAIK